MSLVITYWLSTNLLLVQWKDEHLNNHSHNVFDIKLVEVIDYVKLQLNLGNEVTVEVLV